MSNLNNYLYSKATWVSENHAIVSVFDKNTQTEIKTVIVDTDYPIKDIENDLKLLLEE